MRSKQITDRQKEALAVIAAGETHRAEIIKGLGAILTPVLRSREKLPDLELFIELHLRSLQQALDTLLETDEAYQRELLDDDAPRQARDAAAALLYERLVELRELVTGVYGAAAAREAGFNANTPRDPVQLSRFANQVGKALASVKLPKPRLRGASLQTRELSDELDEKRKELDGHLAVVARETKEAQAALSARQTAQDLFDERYTGVASLLSGLLRLAGKPDLADRVRMTWRRSSTEPPVVDPASPAPNPAPNPANPTP
jgi:hypothetical protein